MKFGVTIFATDLTMDIAELATALEDRGFDSLWLPEHTHIPTERRTPPPIGGGELPEEYRRTLDPFVALSFAASVTTTLRLGTGILLPAQREPIVTAKSAATLAMMSNGRFELGVGFGWNEDEMENHGVQYRTRRAQTREHMLAMQRLWNDEVAEFSGDYVNVSPSWSWPKPPAPIPVLVGGGAGPKLFSHIAEYGTGWIPIGGSGLAQAIPQLKETFAAAGRNPDDLEIAPFGTIPTESKLEHFAGIGVTEVVLRIPSGTREEVLPQLDAHTDLINKVRANIAE